MSMTGDKNHPPIIVAAMHRSGASLVASILGAFGIDMGERLLPADPNNARGYFEDIEFLDLQRRILSSCCRDDDGGHVDWGWTESESLDPAGFQRFASEASALVSRRAAASKPWGWRDPRTTLLLDFWNSLLDDARYVLVYRFPWDVADSMQRLGADVFLRNPEYAYRIWLYYNDRIRKFFTEHSGKCLLISSNAVSGGGSDLRRLIARKLGVETSDPAAEGLLDRGLFRTTEGFDPLIDLVGAVWPDCTRLLSELDELADISGKELWQARPARSRLLRPDAGREAQVDVSIVTPCYNQGVLLIEAVASAERNAPAGCEIIIVNDGSTDARTLEILAILKERGYFVIDQENLGLSAARNTAIGIARGRFILPLDDDNRIRPCFIKDAVSILDGNPEIGVVYGDRYDFGLRTGAVSVQEFSLPGMLRENYIDACAVFTKRLWTACGGFDPSMSPKEDWELWIHAADLGWRFYHLPYLTFDYRVRPGSLISRFQSDEALRDYRARIFAKHPHLRQSVMTRELTPEGDRRELLRLELAAEKGRSELLQGELAAERERAASLARDVAAERERVKSLVDDVAVKIAEKDREIESLTGQIAATANRLGLVSAELADRQSELARIKASPGWGLWQRYGRIKHAYLLPLYRLLGLTRDRA